MVKSQVEEWNPWLKNGEISGGKMDEIWLQEGEEDETERMKNRRILSFSSLRTDYGKLFIAFKVIYKFIPNSHGIHYKCRISLKMKNNFWVCYTSWKIQLEV